jgi:hypothetical protein
LVPREREESESRAGGGDRVRAFGRATGRGREQHGRQLSARFAAGIRRRVHVEVGLAVQDHGPLRRRGHHRTGKHAAGAERPDVVGRQVNLHGRGIRRHRRSVQVRRGGGARSDLRT